MGFSLKGAIGGLARGGSSILDSKKKEEDEQRERVDTNIFNTTGLLFEKASQQQKVRQAEIKANQEFSNLLISKDRSMAKDPAKMAYALSLPKTARDDLLALADSPIFKTNDIPLADYFDAIDDPIEYGDPVTLTERVMGKVVDRPLEASQYYGVSTTEDKEVDKIVAGYAGGFATAYGMSPPRAQGLLDSATQEVKMQRFEINWANKKRRSAQDDAANVAKIALTNVNTEKANQELSNILETQSKRVMKTYFTAFANSQGIPPSSHAADPALPAKFKANIAFGQARDVVIRQLGEDMIANKTRSLDRSTTLFFSREYPGYWGGNANDIPINEIVDAKYYEIRSNGEVEILRGFRIKEKIKANAGKLKSALSPELTTDSSLGAYAPLGEDSTSMAAEVSSSTAVKDQSSLQAAPIKTSNPEIRKLKQELKDSVNPRQRQAVRRQIIQAEESQSRDDQTAEEQAEYDRYSANELDTATLVSLVGEPAVTGRTNRSPNLVYRKIKELYPTISDVVARRFSEEAVKAYKAAN
tara:strand:+ start:3667 stop:5253 length:1587 start_codon:yes stop_codon:yes gene_type:complete